MDRIQTILNQAEPAKWVFYGDSITHGARHTFGARDYTQLFAERLRAEMPRPQDIVINSAISGNTTRELLATFDWRVSQFRPDVVFLMIGMNDCRKNKNLPSGEFLHNLNKLTDHIQHIGATVVLQTCNPIRSGSQPEREERLAVFAEIIRQVSLDRQSPLIDHFNYWQQFADRVPFWLSDSVHPNTFGHIQLAHHLFRNLNIFDSSSNTCRLFAP